MTTPPAEPLLDVRDLRRSYGEGRGLAGASLRVGAGEIYGLLGPNGAGKTSLVRAVSGRLRLDAGTVRLAGGDPADPRARRRLGLVPQEIALYHDLTVTENLRLLGEMAGLGRAAAVVAVPAALEWTGLGDAGGRTVAQLSGGQKRRVNLAAGVLHEPSVLVLDEPSVGVDLAARDRIHRMLRDLRDRGMAILLATHDLEQAAELADRVGIMVAGAIRVEGTVSELVARYYPDGGRDLTITLATPAAAPAVAALTAAGLAATDDPLTWAGALAGGMERLPGLLAELAVIAGPVRDARIRDPGLSGVFLRATGREASP